MPTEIHIANFVNQEGAERLRARLNKIFSGSFYQPTFLVCPIGGMFGVYADTNYDFSTDFEGQPQDPQKGFQQEILSSLAFELSKIIYVTDGE